MVFIPKGFDIRYWCETNIKYPFISPCDNQNVDTVLASSAVDRGFEPRSGQTNDYNICIRCFSHKHAVVSIKKKEHWLVTSESG
jgi:hypothetical protein